MPLGNLAAQLTHAAGESSPGNLPPNTHVVVLAAPNEGKLLRAHRRLSDRDIPHVLIREPDAPFNGEATAIGVYPIKDRRPVRRAFAGLKLLKGDSHDARSR